MANSQDVVDAFAGEMIKLKDDYWYSGYLGNLYLLAISGNMWNPEIVSQTGTVRNGSRAGISNARIVNHPGRELVISGLSDKCVVTLSSLSGKQIVSQVVTTGNNVCIDVSAMRHGCYVVTLADVSAGKKVDKRVVNLY
jgi:hypothetical protein